MEAIDRRAVAADARGHELGDQRHSRAELSREPEASDEPARSIRVDGAHEGVGQVGHGVQEDAPEEDRPPPGAISVEAEEHPAQHQPRVLPVEDRQPRRQLLRRGDSELPQARHAHHRVEQDVEDVDEVAQRGHGDGQDDSELDRRPSSAARNGCGSGHRSLPGMDAGPEQSTEPRRSHVKHVAGPVLRAELSRTGVWGRGPGVTPLWFRQRRRPQCLGCNTLAGWRLSLAVP